MNVSPVKPNLDSIMSSEPPSRKLTDNFELRNSVETSLSVSTLKQRITSSFLQSSTKLLKDQVPKSVQIDDTFEFDADYLDDVKTVTLVFWRSKEAFDAVHQRTSSLYDGFEVNPKQSMASQTSEARDAAQYLFGPRSPEPSQLESKKDGPEQIQTDLSAATYGQCEIKLKSITKKSYNSDWFKIRVSPEFASQCPSLKKNEVIAKILISSQIWAPSKNVPQKSGLDQQDMEQSSSYGAEDCLEEECYLDDLDGLKTLFCNTFSSGKSLKQFSARRSSSRGAAANMTCDDSLVNTYKNLEELMNQNRIQNQNERNIDQNKSETPEAPMPCGLSCLPCTPSHKQPRHALGHQRQSSCQAPR